MGGFSSPPPLVAPLGVLMMLLLSQSISYFNLKRTICLKGYQKGNYIKPINFSQCLFLAAVILMALCGCRFGNP